VSDRPVLPVNEHELLAAFERAALRAGAVILPHFRSDCQVALKADASPVTLADREAEAEICAVLEAEFPQIAIIAEERCELGAPPPASACFFLVDPLDGTREFIEKSPEFTVNIALIVEGYPAAGLVYAPAMDVLYGGGPSGAYRKSVSAGPDGLMVTGAAVHVGTKAPEAGLKALVSRKHFSTETERFLQDAGVVERLAIGSSLKFCLIAEGSAHLYPRFTRTMQWDTAAGDAVLRAAGGTTLRADDLTTLTYPPPTGHGALANPSFIARHGPDEI
jgi:3'(2'), 5'-bisphosphate nucleotidase